MASTAVGAINDARVLKTLLNDHLEARSLVSGRRQRINRNHYLSLANVSSSPEVKAVFDEFDSIVRAMLEVTDDDWKAVAAYVETALATRTLAVRNGRINRRRIERIFGYPDGVFDEEPVPEFLAIWEQRIIECGYIPDTRAITGQDNERILNPVKPRSPFREHSRSLDDDSLANTLFRAIQQDYTDGTLQLNKYGRISRKTYADRFRIAKSSMTKHRATDLPRKFHPAAIRASAALNTPTGAVGATGGNAKLSSCAALEPVAAMLPA